MKKILLIIALTLLIFQMVVLATEITIGQEAKNRASYLDPYIMVNMGVAADGTGKITSIEIWANTTLSDCKVATFFVVSGNNLSTRDVVTLGSVTSGSKQTFTVDSNSNPISLDVQEGDYIGMKCSAGRMERDTVALPGIWYNFSEEIPCENVYFDILSGDAISLYATGATEEAEEDNAIFFGTNF